MLEDLRFALRQLRKSPGFAVTAVLTLALGIGANTAIFSLLDQALLRSLPVRDPGQLVLLEATPADVWNGHTSTEGGDREAYFSYPMYKDLRDRNQVFDGLIAVYQAQTGILWRGRSALANAELVSGNYFSVLGVQPAVGRLLVQSDDVTKNGAPVAVLNFNYWKAHFASDPHVVGQTLSVNGHPFQIVGVAAPGFSGAIWGSPADLYVPMTMKAVVTPTWDELYDHQSRWMNILGRLKPGETRAQAAAGMAPLWRALRTAELPLMGNNSRDFREGFVTHSKPELKEGAAGFSYSRDDLRTPLLVVMAMALLAVLMAAVNVASLVLVRSAGRVREFSMRYALGAKRTQVGRQLLIEGLLLGILGGGAGLALAPAAIRLLLSQLLTGDSQPPFSRALDGRVLAFNFAFAIGVSLLFTLAPALQFWKPDLVNSLKQQSAASTGGRLTFRRITVALQIGLSLLLLIGCGLFVQTLRNLRHVNVGFATDHLITFGLEPNLAGYDESAVGPLHKQVLERLAALPGVAAVGATNDPELADDGNSGHIMVQGYTRPGEPIDVEHPIITTDYFNALKVPIVAGRAFADTDDKSHPKVIIVNQQFAMRVFGSPQKAIGHMLGDSRYNTKYDIQIVGVAGNYIHRTMRSPIKVTVFYPFNQEADPGGMYYYVRSWESPQATMSAIRSTVAQIDSRLVVDGLSTMDEQIDQNLVEDRMIALLAACFGGLATLLAGIGLYGVLAYATAQRTREIGVRIALGSDRAGIVRLVLRDILLLAGISIAVTIPVAFVAMRLVRTQLFGVSALEPVVYMGAVALIAAVAVVSAALPARRAAGVEPMEALRSE
jgi:putative ABC transport system permease protein